MTRPRKNPLTRQVVEHLQSLIVQEGVTEGDPLPSQVALAETLGVSQIVVREATRILEAQGLVHAEHGRRLTVGRPDARQLGELFSLIVCSDEAALLEPLEVRRALELYFVRMAAERATPDDVASMREASAALRGAAKADDEAQAAADGSFHRSVAAGSGSRVLAMLLDALEPSLQRLRIRSLEGTWARLGSLDEVAEGHEAVVARGPDGAVAEMSMHLGRTSADLRVPVGPRPESLVAETL